MTRAGLKALVVETPQGRAGMLRRESQYVFNYDTSDPSCQVAIGLPLRHESYASNILPGAFTQNLPEGYLLQRIQRSLARYEKLTDMRLLALLGNRQIGRLQFHEPGQPAPAAESVDLNDLLHGGRSPELFEYLIQRFMASGISGVQPKVMVASQQPHKASMIAPDLIIKSAGTGYPFLTQNEYLCMSAARRAGVNVPEFWLSDDEGLFILRRFDLVANKPLGFEDMATVLSQVRDATGDYKYRGSYEAIARVVGTLCRQDLPALFDYIALSVLLRNGDAHLKNFGLLYDDPSQPNSIRLAPLYDVVTTTIYSHMTYQSEQPVTDRTLALKLNQVKAYPAYEQLLAFGRQSCLVAKPEAVIERLTQAMLNTLDAERQRFQNAPEFARLEQEWHAGIQYSGGPLPAEQKAAEAVMAFWNANPMLQDMLRSLNGAGHAADAPWQEVSAHTKWLTELKTTLAPDVLALERRAQQAVRAMTKRG